jgi:hypothetical protein
VPFIVEAMASGSLTSESGSAQIMPVPKKSRDAQRIVIFLIFRIILLSPLFSENRMTMQGNDGTKRTE